jgi:putative transposase
MLLFKNGYLSSLSLLKSTSEKKKVVGKRWRMDEIYVKVKEQWRYLYRAVDKKGNTVDFLLTKRRQRISSQRFLIKAIGNNGRPALINIDKSGLNTKVIKLYNRRSYSKIKIRQCKYLNNNFIKIIE